jgi:hypothetical protein
VAPWYTSKMDLESFWRAVSMARDESGGEADRTAGVLLEVLVEQSIETILGFDRALYELIARSYTRQLWAAAFILNYGTSDDRFEYFVGWLIAQGQEIFEAALFEADSLADVVEAEGAAECESMLYTAQYAYERRTSQEIPTRQRRVPPGDVTLLKEEELPSLCPRLWAKFCM